MKEKPFTFRMTSNKLQLSESKALDSKKRFTWLKIVLSSTCMRGKNANRMIISFT